MEKQHSVEESQQINQEIYNQQNQQKRIQSIQSQDEEEQINNSHFKNLSSSSIQNVLSEQNSDYGQENQDEFNFLMQEQNQKKNIEKKQNQQYVQNQEQDQKQGKLVKEESNTVENQVVQVQELKNDDKEIINYSQTSNNQGNKDVKQVSINNLIKQIPTEISDQKLEKKQLDEDELNNERVHKGSQQIEKLKSIIKSPKSGSSQIQSGDPSLDKSILLEKIQKQKKNEQQYNQMMETHLNEIFQFYTKQFINPIKLLTKDQIFEKKQVLNLQQFMHFCKDFKLIDLLVTNDFILKYAGSKSQKPLYKIKYKNRVKDSYVITKQILEEIFQKSSGIKQLSFSEFQYSLIKIADIIFPVSGSGSVKALNSYLGLHDPEIYSKKLTKVEDLNQSRMQDQGKINIKSEVKKVLPQIQNKPKIESQKIQDTFEISKFIQIQQNNPSKFQQNNKYQANSIRWEDLGGSDKDFDPKKLLFEEDITDQEDALYLKEYMITKQGISKKQEFQKQYQEGQRVNYRQHVDQNQKYKRDQGYTEDVYKEFKLYDLQHKMDLQKHTISLQKNYESDDAQLINYEIAEKNQFQKQKNQLIHPNSFELRKNYNVIKQVSFTNKSQIYHNMSQSNERGQQNISSIEQESKKNILKMETNQKKRELSILVGMKKNQESVIRKIQKK
ncbi:unnamed protein product [Paramecium sonneborni]|uniref:Uncharacterized protein n=1 Tax=Paramecium sonneborni TaxID=65129 RepID=A0A8S1K3L6_9CILI|nr:unnamed protein product [Paramecium sonneborni]